MSRNKESINGLMSVALMALKAVEAIITRQPVYQAAYHGKLNNNL